MPKDIVI